MYKNEYLEECLKNNQGSWYILQGYNNTKNNKYNELVIEDLGFIYSKPEELQLFKNEMIKAEVKEFVITETSTALMKILHTLSTVGIDIKEIAEVKYIDIWTQKEQTKQGIRVIVK
jgi:hypothetical protein